MVKTTEGGVTGQLIVCIQTWSLREKTQLWVRASPPLPSGQSDTRTLYMHTYICEIQASSPRPLGQKDSALGQSDPGVAVSH
ncbi:hypothetical protein EYF80_040249 [Liparis tanakae]|uniref:Uncharacterized protein n=1 Tax=Liparis tanakae TaxID=230148 RepID=A0A4Z2G8F5_9TELE|nr:hypothetical protein EYF80_040249 [Liparis tanakae]